MPSRRDVLRQIALGGAAAATAPLWVENLIAVGDQHAAHRPAQVAGAWGPKVLDARQNELVIAVSELIIPQTDTPGAKAAKVNEYIDAVLAEAPAPEREKFLHGLAWLDMRSEDRYRARFVNAQPAQQVELLTVLSTTATPLPEDKPGVEFFAAIKGLTITGYYTSEVGLVQEIGDDPAMFLPEFKGCAHPEHGA